MKKLQRIIGAASLGLALTTSAAPTDSLESGWLNPPESAKPETWWQWMNGNISKEGITADLEAMKQIGLGGATIVNTSCGILAGKVTFMSPEWREDLKFAVQEANRLGLELTLENCAGWSSSGGPWNTPENAMQHVTFSEARVTGPTHFSVALPQPQTKLDFYRDIAVLAFPAPDGGGEKIQDVAAKDGDTGSKSVLSSPAAATAKPGAVIRRDAMVDLTSRMKPDGRLDWDVPPGKWIILRIGYTPNGMKNHPAAAGGEGLECDKLSKEALDLHWAGFMQKVLDDIKPLGGRGLVGSLIDSYEVHGQNWTGNFREEFQKRCGYDPLTFLPTFTGRVVDNPAVSERFLWDVRRTIADLFADNYYGHFSELCRQHGLISAIEPYTGPFESLQCGAPEDFVMGEFWAGNSKINPSVKLAASVAHIYGKTLVGTETFTARATETSGRWLDDPYSLKALGDLAYCQGVNRYVFHRYAMQPWTNRWPGMTMGGFGFHFERTITWWQQGKAWIDYISHCEFLLQQGRFVADAAYFNGESAPSTMRVGEPKLPKGYDYDGINADVLLHGATVKNGRLTLASGANYAVLILPDKDRDMTPQLMQRIAELVRAGATVVGAPPQQSPSLAGYPDCDAQVKKLAGGLWGKCNGETVTENSFGQGRVVWGKSLEEIFAAQKLAPDFEFASDSGEANLAYCHRVAGEAEIYFVSNQRQQADSADCTFRVSGKTPELWHPDTGVIERAPVWHEQDGRTTVHLTFDPAGSVFVIFRAAAAGDHIVAASGPSAAPRITTSKLKILHAVFGAAGESGGMDVTAKLSELASNGDLNIVANTKTLGRDPAPMHKKELRVDYEVDGKPGQVTVPERKKLTLTAARAASQPPQWETSIAADGRPVVKAWGNVRVELHTANAKVLHAEATDVVAPQEISGAWTLNFPPNWGAPPSVTLDKLISWPDYSDKGVKYFSGTATYEKEIEIPAERLSTGREIWLDLGAVKNFAEVSLNGQNFGVLWKPPFRVNITPAAKAGANKLVVKVTNLWPNRLIGDEQLPEDGVWSGLKAKTWPQWLLDGKPSPTGRLTFTTWHHWTKSDALLESGLLGPVTLQTAEIIPVK